jgi:hypothetical protein
MIPEPRNTLSLHNCKLLVLLDFGAPSRLIEIPQLTQKVGLFESKQAGCRSHPDIR